MKLFNRTKFLYYIIFSIILIAFLSSCETVKRPTPIIVKHPIEKRHFKIHTIAPGETLWRISKIYDVPIATIMHVNHIKRKQNLKLGEKLKIPYAKDPKQIISLYPSSKWKYIIIHHSATEEGGSLQFHKYHRKKGWDSVGYHFVIDNGKADKPNGFIEITPRWLKQLDGAHCKASDMNKKGIGICLVGNFNKDTITKKQLDSLVYLVNKLRKYYKIPMKNILGHKHVKGSKTDCPGKEFPWYWFKKLLKNS